MSNTTLRIIAATVMALIACVAGVLQYFGVPAVKYLGIIIVLAMIVEYVMCIRKADSQILRKKWPVFLGFLVLLSVMLPAINVVGGLECTELIVTHDNACIIKKL